MGTRHLIMAVVDGTTKIAQYGQWDGYPSGQGLKVLKFARKLDLTRDQFLQNLRETRWLTPEECDAIDSRSSDQPFPPELSRDAGADILDLVYEAPRKLTDSTDFGLDTLFCEWAYVLDFDTNTLEVYGGPTTLDGVQSRWPEGVHLSALFNLDHLPSDKDFVAQLDPTDA